MPKPGETGLTRIIHAFGYSLQGIKAALKHEAAFRQEMALFVVLAPAVFFVKCIFFCPKHFVNSAIEAVVDRFGEEHHELAGRAKDMGSAAVLFSLSNVVIIWSFIGYNRFFA